MKYCMICGNQIDDSDSFCNVCGAPQSQPQQQLQPQQQIQPQFQNNMAIQPQYYEGNSFQKKKSKKRPAIILLLAVLVIGVGVGCFLYFNYKKKNGPQRALDDYFEALNNLDRYAVWEVCNPPGQEYNDSGTLYYYFTNRLGYAQGIVQSSDFLRMDRDVMTKYLEGYGYTGDYYDMVQDRQSVTEDDSQIKKAMPGFRASYKLLKMKKASSCEIAFLKNGLTKVYVDNMEEEIENKYGIDVVDGEVYVAKFKLNWEYNGMPYGNDKELWDFRTIKEWLAQGNYSTFENTTKYFDDIDYYMIIYKYGNKWYLYNENIIHWNYNISIKM